MQNWKKFAKQQAQNNRARQRALDKMFAVLGPSVPAPKPTQEKNDERNTVASK